MKMRERKKDETKVEGQKLPKRKSNLLPPKIITQQSKQTKSKTSSGSPLTKEVLSPKNDDLVKASLPTTRTTTMRVTRSKIPKLASSNNKTEPLKISSRNPQIEDVLSQKNDDLVKASRAITRTTTKIITRSKIPKAASPENKIEKPVKSVKEQNANDKNNNTDKKEANANKITNYFKKDTTPKEQRLDQSLLHNINSGKKACWANASLLLSKSQSKSNADPYEFVDDLPKQRRKTRKRVATRSAPYTKLKKEKAKVDGKSSQSTTTEQLKESICSSTLADAEKITKEINCNGKILQPLHQLDISNITVTNKNVILNYEKSNKNNLSNNCRDMCRDEDTELTPVKNDKQADNGQLFKTPALPAKPTDKNYDFFAKATAVSTPKVTPISTKPLREVTNDVKDKVISPDFIVQKTKVDSDNSPLMPADISPINDNAPKSNSEGKLGHQEIENDIDEELDFYSDNEENSRILSGSFVGSEKWVYENECLKRASTPDNGDLLDCSIIASTSFHVVDSENYRALKSPNASVHRDAYSLYGSPICLSPVKNDSEDINSAKSPKKLNKLAKENTKNKKTVPGQSDNCAVKLAKKTYGKKERKPKKDDPSDVAFEKWLRDMTNEFEQVQNHELVIE